MRIMNPFGSFARVAVLATGSVMALGSSGTVNPKPENAAVISASCAVELPRNLEERVKRMMDACRAGGGKPSYAYTMRDESACPAGTMLHGARVTCDGAKIDESAASDGARPSSREPASGRSVAGAVHAANAPNSAFVREMLSAHNKYRSELGLPDLQWSDRLAKHAASWAAHLVELGGTKLVHATGTGEGENLWMGTAGHFSFERMVDGWGGEKKDFIYGAFPKVTRTGRWQDVGHYTQIIWRSTTHVGCALARGGGNDILVCRYSPPGNFNGRKPY